MSYEPISILLEFLLGADTYIPKQETLLFVSVAQPCDETAGATVNIRDHW